MFSRAITAPGCSGSSPALLQFLFFWAANFGSEVPALTRRELSANLGSPPSSKIGPQALIVKQ